MRKPLLIGITGGIGSGKSTVCKVFKSLGVPVYDADSRAKYLMTTDGILISQIKEEFGDLSYDKLGQLDRGYLAAQVFGKPEKLKRLNSLVHPRVGEDFRRWSLENDHHVYLLKEAALLYESGSYADLDRVIVVSSPVALRIKRVLARDVNRSRSQIEDIMKEQMAEDEKLRRANHIIYNDEERLIVPQVLELDRQFRSILS